MAGGGGCSRWASCMILFNAGVDIAVARAGDAALAASNEGTPAPVRALTKTIGAWPKKNSLPRTDSSNHAAE